jgi:two-component system, cell cycle response regulator
MKLIANNNELIQQIESYEKIFDNVRIVDPMKNKVINFRDNEVTYEDTSCYSLWLTNSKCKNCITRKALEKKSTLCKIQHNENKMFLVFATPLKHNGETYALELLKDITENLVFETIDREQGCEIRNIVEDLSTIIMKDTLTELYNRRHIKQMLPIEISKSIEKRECLSIAIVDIDRFKKINDTYGHDIGDIVLKKFAQMLLKSTRNDLDWVARYGGEEFLICLPNTGSDEAYRALERIRRTVEKTKIKVEDKVLQITASFGLYTIKGNEITAIDLIKRADEKLYEAKKRGRNKVII